jgi:hypothetical protein
MYRIALVVDESFGRRVIELAKEVYVWLVQSKENDRWASAALELSSDSEDPLLRGVSTFARAGGEQTDDLIVSLLELIDDHHGEFAHDPPWSEIDVIGAAVTPKIEDAARKYGVVECRTTPTGFRLVRRPTWGDTVRVKHDAPTAMRPGALASVCGSRTAETTDQANHFGCAIGTTLLLVEFSDGSSLELPEALLEVVRDDGE